MNTATSTPAFDPRDLRTALGRFGTGVTVVTTLSADQRLTGVTANSFSSVSLDPAIVLWSLQKTSPSLPAFDDCGRFVVNVLALAQMGLSQRFSSRVPDKFAGVDYQLGLGGLPVLNGCAATFECRVVQRLDVGDHILYLGQVEAYRHQEGSTLLYVQGQYAQSASAELQAA